MKKKLKINIDRAGLSSQEIAARRNFETVLVQARAAKKPFYAKQGFIGGLLAGIILALLCYRFYKSEPKPVQTLVAPVVMEDSTANFAPKKVVVPDKPKELPVDSVVNVQILKPLKKALKTKGFSPDIPFTFYRVNTNQVSSFIHKGGTIVELPALSFRTVNEKRPVSGLVDIHYREFKDAYDILIAGITMKYDTAGQKLHLQSAGMMEIKGFQDGEALEVVPGKKLKIRLASDISSTDYNVYKLDVPSQQWLYKGKDTVIGINLQPRQEVAMDNFLNDASAPTLGEEILKPILPIKKSKAQNFKLVLGDKAKKKWPYYDGIYFELRAGSSKIKKELYQILWKDVSISPTHDSTCMKVRFTGKIDKQVKRTEWLSKQKKDSTKFKNIFGGNSTGFNKKYITVPEDIVLEVEAYPVYSGKDSAYVMAQYYKQVGAYKALLEEAARKQRSRDSMLFRQFAGSRNLNEKQKLAREQVFRVFSISEFGIWNCDQIYKTKPLAQVTVQLIDPSGMALKGDRLSLIYHNVRSVFSYYPFGEGAYEQISVNPSEKVSFFVITENGDIAYLAPDDYAKLPFSDQKIPVRMNIRKNDFTSAEDMKAFMMGL